MFAICMLIHAWVHGYFYIYWEYFMYVFIHVHMYDVYMRTYNNDTTLIIVCYINKEY